MMEQQRRRSGIWMQRGMVGRRGHVVCVLAVLGALSALPRQSGLVLSGPRFGSATRGPGAALGPRDTRTRLGVSTLRPMDTGKIWGKDTGVMYRYPRLTRPREEELGRAVQRAMALQELRQETEELTGRRLSFGEWAQVAGMGPKDMAVVLADAQDARHTFILSNLRLVASIAKKFLNRGVHYEELIQEGTIGMNRAVDLFDPERGIRFSTYASRWVEQRIRIAIKRDGLAIRLPGRLVDLQNKVAAVSRRLEMTLGHAPSVEELVADGDLTASDIEDVQKLPAAMGALDDFTVADRLDFALSSSNAAVEIEPDEYAELATLRSDLELTMLRTLSPSERDIIRLRVGLDDGQARSFNEVAKLLKLTRNDVVRIERHALGKLRCEEAFALLDGYLGVDKEEAMDLALSGALGNTMSAHLPLRGRKRL